MISDAAERMATNLLAKGRHSLRTIARLAGVSRGTVLNIAQGRRRPNHARESAANLPEEPCGPHVRCPGCGRKVQMPCVACRELAAPGRERWPADADEPLALDLRGGHATAYAEVRHTVETEPAELPTQLRESRADRAA